MNDTFAYYVRDFLIIVFFLSLIKHTYSVVAGIFLFFFLSFFPTFVFLFCSAVYFLSFFLSFFLSVCLSVCLSFFPTFSLFCSVQPFTFCLFSVLIFSFSSFFLFFLLSAFVLSSFFLFNCHIFFPPFVDLFFRSFLSCLLSVCLPFLV